MPLVEIKNLCKSFGGLHALKDVSFTAEQGAIKGVIGPNGAGKTTLFNCIAGALKPSSGVILFGGEPIHHLQPMRLHIEAYPAPFRPSSFFPT